MNKLNLGMILLALILTYAFSSPAQATVYFSWSGEDGICGEDLPRSPFKAWDNRKNAIAKTVCEPDGSSYFQWKIANSQHDAFNQVSDGNFPIRAVAGRTYHLAFKVNFTRQGGKDVWHNSPGKKAGECFDKFIEIRGGNGLRWIVHFGEKGMMTPPGTFSTFLASFSKGLNRDVEEWGVYYPNYNGYSRYNTRLLEYETWYNVVMSVTMASNRTGKIVLHVDGEKVAEYKGIKTMEPNSRIDFIGVNGTLGQQKYNINAHTRKMTGLLLTDNWQDIIAGGYLLAPESSPAPLAPAPPAAPAMTPAEQSGLTVVPAAPPAAAPASPPEVQRLLSRFGFLTRINAD
jgi:hypothetical protein